jgi:hypothetical protein
MENERPYKMVRRTRKFQGRGLGPHRIKFDFGGFLFVFFLRTLMIVNIYHNVDFQ